MSLPATGVHSAGTMRFDCGHRKGRRAARPPWSPRALGGAQAGSPQPRFGGQGRVTPERSHSEQICRGNLGERGGRARGVIGQLPFCDAKACEGKLEARPGFEPGLRGLAPPLRRRSATGPTALIACGALASRLSRPVKAFVSNDYGRFRASSSTPPSPAGAPGTSCGRGCGRCSRPARRAVKPAAASFSIIAASS